MGPREQKKIGKGGGKRKQKGGIMGEGKREKERETGRQREKGRMRKKGGGLKV